MKSLPVHGRGASYDPPNRFTDLQVERDAWTDPDDPGPETRLYRDTSRSIVVTNDSPDVGFDASVNPYRGCEHGCVYCLCPETPVLHGDLTWRPIGEVRIGDVLVGFDEHPEPGRVRKLRPSVVEDLWWSRKPTLTLVTERARVSTTANHLWLQHRHFRWSRTERLAVGRTLRRIDAPDRSDPVFDLDYRVGYVAGLSLGDGTPRFQPGQRSDKLGCPQPYWRVALTDEEPLRRSGRFLRSLGVDLSIRPFDPGRGSGSRPLKMLETRSIPVLERLVPLLTVERDSPSYRRGFVAGFFDAEGHDGPSLRISQKDVSVLRRVGSYAGSFGFDFTLEPRPGHASTLRLNGDTHERMRFLSFFDPAIARKEDRIFGRRLSLPPERVEAVESGPTRDVVDITTSTGTFFAAGLATHNCYARPNHEYLGLSAGLDFETKIFVKEDAPRLLREKLASPSWTPKVLALSGVTDPYQPAERRLEITRGCLEVLAEFRNPVAIVTKSHLVTRDIDLLSELADHDAARVSVSVTTLRNELQRVMEPRTPVPKRRLRAIRELADAGVPVGVMVAPVVPGLTEHETAGILEAAAEAGATRAAYILLRLPHAVKELFTEWLEQHFPDRKEKVLNRIRSLRAGRLNDPRFGARQRGEGPHAQQIRQLFEVTCRRLGLNEDERGLSTTGFRRPHGPGGQTELF